MDDLHALGSLVVVWKPIPNSERVKGYGMGIIVDTMVFHYPNWDPQKEYLVLTARGVMRCTHNEILLLSSFPD